METQQQDSNDDIAQGLFIANIWARAVQLPLRHTVGHNHVDGRGALAFVLAFFWGGLCANLPVLVWSGLYLGACFLHRWAGFYRRWKGKLVHSRYSGYPWLCTLTEMPEGVAKLVVEPLLALGLSVLVSPYGGPGVLFFFGGAVCMVATTAAQGMVWQRQRDDLNDAAMEGSHLMSGIRRRRK